jgi:hypothetical protein
MDSICMKMSSLIFGGRGGLFPFYEFLAKTPHGRGFLSDIGI